MPINIKKNRFHLFIIKAGISYGLFYSLYEFLIKPYTKVDKLFIREIIDICRFILEKIGYKTFASKDVNDIQVFGIDGSNGVWIGGPCNAINLMFLFAIFVMAFPGKIKKKIWFIPLGMLIINSINIIRIISLALIANFNYEYLDFNHTYTFTFLVYGVIFALWMLWVNKFSDIN